MRQAVEAQVLSPHCELGEHGRWRRLTSLVHFMMLIHSCQFTLLITVWLCAAGLRQILTDVIREVRQSINQDIDGAEILHSLLNAPWLQSLLKVGKFFFYI